MQVLSLFDGISCARLALDRAGIQVDKYFASEIDKYAIQIASKNYPDTIQVGSVVGYTQTTPIDLLIGGSPCQDLSIAKKNRKGLDGDRSSLFWEYVRILRDVKPKYFVLENVASMSKESKEIITNALLEIYPDTVCHMINASLVSAQNRKRLFWTNIQGIEQPKDRGILLKDVLVENKDRYIQQRARGFNKGGEHHEKSPTLTSNYREQNNQLTDGQSIRKLTPTECERLQGVPDGYTEGVSNSQRYKCLGNAFNVDVVAHILSYISS